MMNTLNLELKFKSAQFKSKKITINNPILDLSDAVVQAAQQAVIDANIFDNEGDNPYAQLDGARYVERTVTDLYNVQ